MSETQMITAFNTLLVEFLRECSKVFSDPTFSTYPSLVSAYITVCPNDVFDRLHSSLFAKYSSRIQDMDESFFLTGTFGEINEGPANQITSMLKNNWLELTDHNKATMWGWLNKLLKLAKKTRPLPPMPST